MMNDALQELERSTDATRAEWVAGEIERLSAALSTAEATIAAALVKLHPEDEVVRPLLAGYLSERQFGSNPAAFLTPGVLAEHDAKVWHEGYIAAERFQLAPKGHWEHNTERGIRTWVRAPRPVNPYRAQVIREEKSDV